MSEPLYLTYDVGGTRLKSGIVDRAGHILARRLIPTEGAAGADDLIARMVALGRELTAETGEHGYLAGVGVAFTGVIDPDAGRVLLLNGKIPDIEGVEVGPRLAAAFGVPAAVDNDTRLYTVGEWRHGAARGYDNVVGVTIGTGIGSGVVLGGRLLQTGGMVGGLLGGHLTVDIHGPLCSCGNRGCLETVGSVPALVGTMQDHLARGCASSLQGTEGLTAERIIDAVTAGDPLATFLFARWTAYLGAGLVTLVHAYDPDVLVVGGGIMQAGDVVLAPLRDYIARHGWTYPKGRVQLRGGMLGDDAALIGGAALVEERARREARVERQAV